MEWSIKLTFVIIVIELLSRKTDQRINKSLKGFQRLLSWTLLENQGQDNRRYARAVRRLDDFEDYFIKKYQTGKKGNSVNMRSFSWVEPFSKSDPEVSELLNNPLSHKLALVGTFLAAYKYFEVDQRYTFMSDDEYIKPKFYRHFPIPRLRSFHPAVKQACDKGVLPCVLEVYKTANNSKSTSKLHRNFYHGDNSIPDYYPLKSKLDLFKYRVTASYYLCWYTDMKNELLAFTAREHCFSNLTDTIESKGRIISDFRANYSGVFDIVSPFTCSFLWFCPDPCYGKTTDGNVWNRTVALKETKNPCKSISDPSCSWDAGENNNFQNLIRNKFNYTCNCASERKGFIWSPLYGICIDQDECYDQIGECPDDKVCRNTIGSYICTCRMGFRKDPVTERCIKNEILRASVYKSIRLRKKQKKKSRTVVFLEAFFGLSNGLQNLADQVMQNVVIVLVCLYYDAFTY